MCEPAKQAAAEYAVATRRTLTPPLSHRQDGSPAPHSISHTPGRCGRIRAESMRNNPPTQGRTRARARSKRLAYSASRKNLLR